MKNLAIKFLTIGLTATLFAGCLTACKANATAGANAPQANQEQAAGANGGGKQIVGGWTIPESTEVTEEHKKIYNNAISKYDGTGRDHEPVALLGFGTFSCKHRDARQGRNPANGETIDIAASNTPVFKAAKVFKDKVN